MSDVMYIVYAKIGDLQIWSDSGAVHKAGRVPLGEKLEVIDVVSGWYEIKRPANINLPVQPKYPRYFVDPDFCLIEPVGDAVPDPNANPVPAPVGDISDADRIAFVKVLEHIFGG